MNASTTVLVSGIACVIAAIVGGGLKAFDIEIPHFKSLKRQALLGLFGLVLIAGSLFSKIDLGKLLSRIEKAFLQERVKQTEPKMPEVPSSSPVKLPEQPPSGPSKPPVTPPVAPSNSCPPQGTLKTAWTLMWAGAGWGVKYDVDTSSLSADLSNRLTREIKSADPELSQYGQTILDEVHSLGNKAPVGPFSGQYGKISTPVIEEDIDCTFNCTSIQWSYRVMSQTNGTFIQGGGPVDIPISRLTANSKRAVESVERVTRPDADVRCIKAAAELSR